MSILSGIAGTIIGSIIVYFSKQNIDSLLNKLFLNVYPDVSGTYNAYFYSRGERSDNQVSENGTGSDEDVLSSDATNRELLRWLKERREEYDIEQQTKFDIEQYANKVYGEIYTVDSDGVHDQEEIEGKITPSRILVLNSETKNEDHHNFGTFLMNVENDQSLIKGVRSYLCINCGDAAHQYLLLEKQED